MAKEDKEAAAAAEAADGEEGREKKTIPLEIKNLPPGVRAVLRLKKWRDVSEYSAYIYRVTQDPAKPGRPKRKFLARVYNTEIDESYLQATYPTGGTFRVIYNIPAPDRGGDAEIQTEDLEIEAQAAVHQQVAPNGAAPPVAASAVAGASRRELFSEMRELVELINALRPDQPQGAPAWLERLYQDKIRRLDDLEQKMERKLAAPIVTNGKSPEEMEAWPEFLRPFVPGIKSFGIRTMENLAQKLMGGNLESMGIRALVFNHPTFREIWSDVERRNAAAQALITSLGEAGENLVKLFEAEMSPER